MRIDFLQHGARAAVSQMVSQGKAGEGMQCIPMQHVLAFADQAPFASSMPASASPQEQRQMLGQRLFQSICHVSPDDQQFAAISTARLLELDSAHLMDMIDNSQSIKAAWVKSAYKTMNASGSGPAK